MFSLTALIPLKFLPIYFVKATSPLVCDKSYRSDRQGAKVYSPNVKPHGLWLCVGRDGMCGRIAGDEA